jgi:hypothetical protein
VSLSDDAEELLSAFSRDARDVMDAAAAGVAERRRSLEPLLAGVTLTTSVATEFLAVAESAEEWAAEIIRYADMLKRHARAVTGDKGVQS